MACEGFVWPSKLIIIVYVQYEDSFSFFIISNLTLSIQWSLVPVEHVLNIGRFLCVRWHLGGKLISTHVFVSTKLISNYTLIVPLTLWHPLGFGDFWKKKHLNACGFAWEFLWSGMLYRPGKSLKRCGKSSSLHSKKIFCLGDAVFLWVTS